MYIHIYIYIQNLSSCAQSTVWCSFNGYPQLFCVCTHIKRTIRRRVVQMARRFPQKSLTFLQKSSSPLRKRFDKGQSCALEV